MKKSFKLSETLSKIDKQDYLTKDGRKKFTSMLKPCIRERLANIAHNNNKSIADVLETIVQEYLGISV
jgi:DNA topoisomerase VI subunit B